MVQLCFTKHIPAGREVICFTMLVHFLMLVLLFIIHTFKCTYAFGDFGENGFCYDTDIPVGVFQLNGMAFVTSGALMLTNNDPQKSEQAFSRHPFGSITSFSTTFVFLVMPPDSNDGVSAHGLCLCAFIHDGLCVRCPPGSVLGPDQHGKQR